MSQETKYTKCNLTESQRVDLMELEFEIDQAIRWMDGAFDQFLTYSSTRESNAKWSIDMAISWCKNVRSWV